jgi:hypothetical protein
MSAGGNPKLFEIKDAWGNPLVYFADADYADAEKVPHTYMTASTRENEGEEGGMVDVKPWRLQTGGFAQPGKFQLFSMGPDGVPNTDDDIKAWEQ